MKNLFEAKMDIIDNNNISGVLTVASRQNEVGVSEYVEIFTPEDGSAPRITVEECCCAEHAFEMAINTSVTIFTEEEFELGLHLGQDDYEEDEPDLQLATGGSVGKSN